MPIAIRIVRRIEIGDGGRFIVFDGKVHRSTVSAVTVPIILGLGSHPVRAGPIQLRRDLPGGGGSRAFGHITACCHDCIESSIRGKLEDVDHRVIFRVSGIVRNDGRLSDPDLLLRRRAGDGRGHRRIVGHIDEEAPTHPVAVLVGCLAVVCPYPCIHHRILGNCSRGPGGGAVAVLRLRRTLVGTAAVGGVVIEDLEFIAKRIAICVGRVVNIQLRCGDGDGRPVNRSHNRWISRCFVDSCGREGDHGPIALHLHYTRPRSTGGRVIPYFSANMVELAMLKSVLKLPDKLADRSRCQGNPGRLLHYVGEGVILT